MPKSRKFIDRKHAITFQVVHRSQHDPLIADESAPQRVLLPVQSKESKVDKDKRKEEQVKYGIYYDDDYNYLQHLREPNPQIVDWARVEEEKPEKEKEKAEKEKGKEKEKPKLLLPSSVFASEVEEKVGMLNKAAPQGLRLDLDPDVVAAMDEDFDFDDPDNQLEDNFIEMANAECSDVEEEEENDEEDERSDIGSDFEDDDTVGSLDGPQYSFKDEELKSRFTDYSMSSSVMRRNEGLTLLDDRFEKMFQTYDETEVGALDCEDIEGFIDPNSDYLLKCAEEFEKEMKNDKLDRDAIARRLQEESSEDEDKDEDLVRMPLPEKEKWDCESILSTYSNLYNHPKLIEEPAAQKKIRINPKTGIPIGVLGMNKLTAEALEQFNQQYNQPDKGLKSTGGKSVLSQLTTLSIRNKNETPEEKKDRKKALRDYRRARREEKKANAEAFKEETKRQVKIAINNKNNVQGNRIL